MTRTRRLDFGSGPDADPAYQWETKRKLAEVCTLRSTVLVIHVLLMTGSLDFYPSVKGSRSAFEQVL